LTPNELDLCFPAPNDCAKFHQILFIIAIVRAMTDTQKDTQTHRQTDANDFIICPMLCNSNGTDNQSCVRTDHRTDFLHQIRCVPRQRQTPSQRCTGVDIRETGSDVKSSRPKWPRVQNFGLGLGLVALASASRFWPRLTSLETGSVFYKSLYV